MPKCCPQSTAGTCCGTAPQGTGTPSGLPTTIPSQLSHPVLHCHGPAIKHQLRELVCWIAGWAPLSHLPVQACLLRSGVPHDSQLEGQSMRDPAPTPPHTTQYKPNQINFIRFDLIWDTGFTSATLSFGQLLTYLITRCSPPQVGRGLWAWNLDSESRQWPQLDIKLMYNLMLTTLSTSQLLLHAHDCHRHEVALQVWSCIDQQHRDVSCVICTAAARQTLGAWQNAPVWMVFI